MDDTKKTAQTIGQNNQQIPAQPQMPFNQPQDHGVAGGAKEMPPVTNEWVSPSNPEIVLPQEVKEAGVEANPTVQPIPSSAANVGVKMAREATPVKPVEEEQIGMQTPRAVLTQLKNIHKSVKDSFTWLVRLVIKEQDKKEKGAAL